MRTIVGERQFNHWRSHHSHRSQYCLQFNLGTVRTGLPACTTASASFSINVNTLAGQTMAATLLTAMASNLPVDIGGMGTCEFANLEAVGYLAIHR